MFDEAIMSRLGKGHNTPDLKRKVYSRVVDLLRLIDKSIPKTAIQRVALQMKDAYPKTFMESDSKGVEIGNGVSCMVKQMMDHNAYLNRLEQSQLAKVVKTSLKNQRGRKYVQAGCIKWDPQVTQENLNIIEEKRQYLLSFETLDVNNDAVLKEIVEAMNICYASRREHLNDLENAAKIIVYCDLPK